MVAAAGRASLFRRGSLAACVSTSKNISGFRAKRIRNDIASAGIPRGLSAMK
jgi:hypothetical protein